MRKRKASGAKRHLLFLRYINEQARLRSRMNERDSACLRVYMYKKVEKSDPEGLLFFFVFVYGTHPETIPRSPTSANGFSKCSGELIYPYATALNEPLGSRSLPQQVGVFGQSREKTLP